MALTQAGTKPAVEYPSTDGEPMAQNTKQYRYITTIQGGLAAMFRDRPDVFVAGDLFWYPIEGDNKTRAAPDVMVVFGRPKGDRDSYRQWEEDNIAPQVVFEILSPSNTLTELLDKSLFYGRFVGYEELAAALEQAQARAEQERLLREQEQQRAEQERLLREQEQQRAEQERLLREQEQQRAERLAQRLRELGVEPE
jgi:Uma2 family endonuclease